MADPQHGWTPVDESAWTDVAPPPMDPKNTLAYQRAHAGDVLTEGADAPPSGLMQALSHAAYPQSAGDFASLLIPQGASTAISAGGAGLRQMGKLRGPVGSAIETVGDVAMHPWQLPGRALRAIGRTVKGADPRYSASTSPIAPVTRAQDLAAANQRFDRIVQEARDARPPDVAPSAIVDEAGMNLGPDAVANHPSAASLPDRRVSGPAARQAWDDQAHALHLENLGGRGSAAETFATKYGTPGDAEMAMAVSHRNTAGSWAPAASTVRAPVSLNEAMDAAVKAQQARAALLEQLAPK